MSLKFKEAMETCESEKPNHGAFQRSCCSEKLKFRRQRRQANDALFAELTSSFAVPLKVRVVLDVEYEYEGTFVQASTNKCSLGSTFPPSSKGTGLGLWFIDRHFGLDARKILDWITYKSRTSDTIRE